MTALQEPLNSDADIYYQLETYDWDQDKEFQGGLSAILGPNTSPSQVQDLTLHAQCFYLSRKKNVPVDFISYKLYLENKYPENFLSSSTLPTSTKNAPDASEVGSHQGTPPRPLTLAEAISSPNIIPSPSNNIPSGESLGASSSNGHIKPHTDVPPAPNQDGAPYPPTFAEIVTLITSGGEIPGLKDIPDTTLPMSLASKPTLPRRRKPWEKDIPEHVILNGTGEGLFGDYRDIIIKQELPEDDKVKDGAEQYSVAA